MKSQKILKKLEDLNLFRKITIHAEGKIEAIVGNNELSDTDLRHLLLEFKAKKYNLNLTMKNNELVLEVTKLISLRDFTTRPPFLSPLFPQAWPIRHRPRFH